jgi:hypothetical protein
LAGQGQEPGPRHQVGGDLGEHQPDLVIANSRDGNRPSPVSLACRMRSSTRAWAR